MYLSKRTYVKNWAHRDPKNRWVITVDGPAAAELIRPERISYIIEEIAYWRKANAIHRWFVKNVQAGKDDQGDHYVLREQLQMLLDDVNTVLSSSKLMPGQVRRGAQLTKGEWETIYEDGKIVEDNTVAAKVLPCESGFFYGSTDYDEYYIRDLEYTRDVLTAELACDDLDSTYEYHADW